MFSLGIILLNTSVTLSMVVHQSDEPDISSKEIVTSHWIASTRTQMEGGRHFQEDGTMCYHIRTLVIGSR